MKHRHWNMGKWMEAVLTERFTVLNDHRKALLKITNKWFKSRFLKTRRNSEDYRWNSQTEKDNTNYKILIKRRKASTIKITDERNWTRHLKMDRTLVFIGGSSETDDSTKSRLLTQCSHNTNLLNSLYY